MTVHTACHIRNVRSRWQGNQPRASTHTPRVLCVCVFCVSSQRGARFVCPLREVNWISWLREGVGNLCLHWEVDLAHSAATVNWEITQILFQSSVLNYRNIPASCKSCIDHCSLKANLIKGSFLAQSNVCLTVLHCLSVWEKLDKKELVWAVCTKAGSLWTQTVLFIPTGKFDLVMDIQNQSKSK